MQHGMHRHVHDEHHQNPATCVGRQHHTEVLIITVIVDSCKDSRHTSGSADTRSVRLTSILNVNR